MRLSDCIHYWLWWLIVWIFRKLKVFQSDYLPKGGKIYVERQKMGQKAGFWVWKLMRRCHYFHEISLVVNTMTLEIGKTYLSSPNKSKTLKLLSTRLKRKFFQRAWSKWRIVKMGCKFLFFLHWLSKSSTCGNKLIVEDCSLSISPSWIHILKRKSKIWGLMEAGRWRNIRFSSKLLFLCKKSRIPSKKTPLSYK